MNKKARISLWLLFVVSWNKNYPEIFSVLRGFDLTSHGITDPIISSKTINWIFRGNWPPGEDKGTEDMFPVRLFVLYKGGLARLWPQVLAWLGSKVWIIGQSDGQECISYFTTADYHIHFICARLGWFSLIYHTNWESVQLIQIKPISASSARLRSPSGVG